MSESKKVSAGRVTAIEDLRTYLLSKKLQEDGERVPDSTEQALREIRALLRRREDEERRGLARELRDATGVELLRSAGIMNDAASEYSIAPSTAELLQENLQRLAARLRDISQRLYPSISDDLGAVAAMRSVCQAFHAASGIDIRFAACELSSPLPRGISLCLHRFLQDALRNAVHHTDAPHIAVSLRQGEDDVTLTVVDNGAGIDLHTPYPNSGLGFMSMIERAHELGGRVAIESGPEAGTSISCTLPLKKRAATEPPRGELAPVPRDRR